jgi:hypothetical protein
MPPKLNLKLSAVRLTAISLSTSLSLFDFFYWVLAVAGGQMLSD